jgi:hypothetical protein
LRKSRKSRALPSATVRAALVLVLAGAAGITVSGCRASPIQVDTGVQRLVDDHAAAPPRRTASAVPRTVAPSGVDDLVARVDPERMHADIETLVGFGTRHTLSASDDPKRGIGAARRWIAQTFEGAKGGLQVSMDSHRLEPDGNRIDTAVEVVNVVAVLPGRMPEAAARRYYVIGHYDSRASNPMDRTSDAPGANDDGSGVAVTLELARVLADAELDATVVFLATAGEEQGLLGAAAHAADASERGLDIQAVLSNDIVGDPTGPGDKEDRDHVRVFSADLGAWLSDEDLDTLRRLGSVNDSPSRQLARYIDTVAKWHALPLQPMLVARRDRFLRGGDHTAFNQFGFPAVRFCEVWENYDHQHQDVRREGDTQYGDLPQFVDAEYLAGVAKLNLATVVHLANAPAPPTQARIIAAGLTNDTTLRWAEGPEPDVAGYEVVWRSTTSFIWEESKDVGPATEATLPLSKDNWFFGVRAYDRDGYRSPVAFPSVATQ